MLKEWIPIKGYERYEVNKKGDIRYSPTGKIRKRNVANNGYCMVLLRDLNTKKFKNLSVHRLVAEAFIPNPDNLPVVNHKDGNKLNNSVDNLEWATRSENSKHSYRTGLQIHPQLGRYGWKSFNGRPVRQVDLISGKTIKEYGSICDAARQLNVHQENISACARGITNSCAGFKWKYSEKGGK